MQYESSGRATCRMTHVGVEKLTFVLHRATCSIWARTKPVETDRRVRGEHEIDHDSPKHWRDGEPRNHK